MERFQTLDGCKENYRSMKKAIVRPPKVLNSDNFKVGRWLKGSKARKDEKILYFNAVPNDIS
jgi:hypothetical protein